eukprot:886661-Prymnesium_polylepis.1
MAARRTRVATQSAFCVTVTTLFKPALNENVRTTIQCLPPSAHMDSLSLRGPVEGAQACSAHGCDEKAISFHTRHTQFICSA